MMSRNKLMIVLLFAIIDLIYTFMLLKTGIPCFENDTSDKFKQFKYCGIEKYILFSINIVVSQYVYFYYIYFAY